MNFFNQNFEHIMRQFVALLQSQSNSVDKFLLLGICRIRHHKSNTGAYNLVLLFKTKIRSYTIEMKHMNLKTSNFFILFHFWLKNVVSLAESSTSFKESSVKNNLLALVELNAVF